MNPSRLLFSLSAALAAGAAIANAQPSSPEFNGKFDLKVTARYESAEQSGLPSADALTLGTDLGYCVSYGDTFKAYAQLENTTALDGDSYNQAGLNPGGAGKVVIADPEITELNQLWISAKLDGATATLGRQVIILDNARFVGNVGWRQNMQTFDAARVAFTSDDQALTFNYAYLDQVLRIFGRDHPQGEWDSNSHLFNVAWKARPDLTVTAYSYLLDFSNAAANSCATNGIILTGKRNVADGLDLVYRAEFARQSDHASSPLDYTAEYWAFEGGLSKQGWTGVVGYEDLGSDHRVGFKTPLATGHAFNGWADLFLATPADGLADLYLRATGKVAGAYSVVAAYHRFSASDGNAEYGTEIDLSVARPLNKQVNLLAKFAQFSGTGPRPDVTKFWLQATCTY